MDQTRQVIRRILTEAAQSTGMGWITDEGEWIPSEGYETHEGIALAHFVDADDPTGDALEAGWVRVNDGLFQVYRFDDSAKNRISDHLKAREMWSGSVDMESSEPHLWGRVQVSDLTDRGLTAAQLLWKYSR